MKNPDFCYNRSYSFKTNPYHANLLQDLYMGSCGEVVSFLQFTYQSNQLIPFGKPQGKIFKELACDDNFHLTELAELIILLGGNIEYCHAKKFLSGSIISYSKDIKSMLHQNIEMKEKSIIAYKIAVAKIENINIKNKLIAISKTEEHHLFLLKNELAKI